MEEVAQETGSKFMNLHEIFKGKTNQELCANQKFSIDPREGLRPNYEMNIHWGRPEIIAGLTDLLL